MTGAGPLGEYGRVVHILVAYDRIQLAHQFNAALNFLIDSCARGDMTTIRSDKAIASRKSNEATDVSYR